MVIKNLSIISLIIITISIFFIFDSRDIAAKHFSKDETNTTIRDLKVLGLILSWIGMGMFYFSLI